MFTRTTSRITAIVLTLILLVTTLSTQAVVAAPGASEGHARGAAQNVDWMSADQAARLALDFTVLVPSWIPAPFGGSPSIQAGGGYYSLYWMTSGGDPTFLQITGEVGGALPAGSPADLNQQLFVNASVQGYDAIHDVTSIYDNVWWIAGGVLYTVSSKNMTGTDSLSLANSLIALQQPAPPAPEPTPTPEPAPEESSPTGSIANASSVESGGSVSLEVYPSAVGTLRATDGVFASSGASSITGLTGGAVSWQAPSVADETTVEFTLLDADTGVVTDWSSIVVYPVSTGGNTETGSGDTGVPSEPATDTGTGEAGGTETNAGGTGEGDTAVPETETESPTAVQTPEAGGTNGATASDGTAGAQIPQVGDGTAGPDVPRAGDGTGGTPQLVIP